MVTDELTDDEWRTLLGLILRHVSSDRFQQWDMFSLPLSGTTNRLYVEWGMGPPRARSTGTYTPWLTRRQGR